MRIILGLFLFFITQNSWAEFLYQGPGTIDFGQIPVSQSAEEVLSYKNASQVPASYNVSFIGKDARFFTVSMNQCVNVAAAQSCSITVKFTANNKMQNRVYSVQVGSTTLTANPEGPFLPEQADISALPQQIIIMPQMFTFTVSKSRPFIRSSKEFVIINRTALPQSFNISLTGKDSGLYSILSNSCLNQIGSGLSCRVVISLETSPLNGSENLAELSVNGLSEAKITYQQIP